MALAFSGSIKDKSDYCRQVDTHKEKFDAMLEYTKPTRSPTEVRPSDPDGWILSKFTYQYDCGRRMHTAVSYIEPLAGHLRHPWGWCKPEREVHYEFLIPAFLDDAPAKHWRHLLYDMGARTYSLGVGLNENGTKVPCGNLLRSWHQAGPHVFVGAGAGARGGAAGGRA